MSLLKVIDLKRVPGAIPDNEAVDRIRIGLSNARIERQRIILIIHGYGSTGVGGSNKSAIHRFLDAEKQAGRIQKYIPGETLTSGHLRDYKRKFSGNSFDSLNVHARSRNPGVTVVEI